MHPIRKIIRIQKVLKQYIKNIWTQKLMQYYMRKGLFPVEIKTSEEGIGVRFVWCLQMLAFCEEKKLTPFFKFSYKDSRKDEDLFNAFFRLKNEDKNIKFNYITIEHIGELALENQQYDRDLSLQRAHELIAKNIEVRESLSKEIDDFCRENFKGEEVLGVHYRGTDKKIEMDLVSFERVLKNIEYCQSLYPKLKRIFVTTDDAHFIEFMKKSRLSSSVFFHEDYYRSDNGDPIHRGQNASNYYEVNKDAIINMLILARCSFIMKTASMLSAISLLFNPSIPYMILNKPFADKLWFPESKLIPAAPVEPVA